LSHIKELIAWRASKTLSCQRETLHSQQLRSIKKSIDSDHGIYRGGGPAIQDLIAGRIDYFCTLSATAKPQIEAKLIKAIAILSRERSAMVPDLASAREQGLDFEASTWFGFFFPRGTPEPIIQKLHDATVAAMDTPSVQERLKEVGAVTVAPERRSPAYLQKFVVSEIEKNAAPIRAAGLAMD
jgi:tripartite-type tricarboxylate transporter receptor subunit TctC